MVVPVPAAPGVDLDATILTPVVRVALGLPAAEVDA
jgi:hypothetical protein